MSVTVDITFDSVSAADLIPCVGSDCGCDDCVDCPCLHGTPVAMCGNFGTWVSGPCPGLYGDQTLNPDFPTDGGGNPLNCEWEGISSEGCGAWSLFFDCDHWTLASSIGTYTAAAGDFNCVTGGTFTGGGEGLPGSVTLSAC